MWDILIGILVFSSVYRRITLFLIKNKLKKNNHIPIIPGAEPYLLQPMKKTKRGVILIHGFTATPQEMRELGNYLYKKGITIYAPLLSGHGTVPEDLFRSNAQDWCNDIEKSISLLSNHCTEIYLIGNSFGGNLAFLSASKHQNVKGVIALATPFIFRYDKIGKSIAYTLSKIKLFKKKHYQKNVKEIYKNTNRICYDQIPLHSLLEMLKVVKESKSSLSTFKKNVLLMQSEQDNLVSKKSIHFALENIPSKNKKVIWIPESIHVFISDKHKTLAFKEIEKFICQ